jgi:hypothetical protein
MKTTFILIIFITVFNLKSISQKPNNQNIKKDSTSKKMENIKLPKSKDALLIRTDFGDDKKWNELIKKVNLKYEDGFKAYVETYNNSNFKNLDFNLIFNLKKEDYDFNFLFIADSLTLNNVENPIICIELYTDTKRFFRVIPSELWSVENNLTISNMEFEEFYSRRDKDNIFRGF